MKYIFCCLLSLFFARSTVAQINKNQRIWTAQLNSQLTHYSQILIKNPVYDFGLNANAGVFIRDGLALGLDLQGAWTGNYTRIENANDYKFDHRSRSGSLTPFVRKYWKIAPFIVYAGGGVNLSATKISSIQQVNSVVNREHATVHQVTPQTQVGILYPVTNRLGLEVAAQSALFPVSFNTVRLGLVLFSGADAAISNTAVPEPQQPLAKGRWLLSGTFSSVLRKGSYYDGKTANDYREPSTSIDIAPGVFIRDRLLVGMGVYVGLQGGALASSQAAGFVSTGNHKPLMVGVRPYVKKYFSSTRLTPYLQGYVSYNRIMAGAPATNTVLGGGNFGLACLLGKNWLVEGSLLGLSASYSKLPDLETDIAKIYGRKRFSADLDAGFQPAFTIAYVFP